MQHVYGSWLNTRVPGVKLGIRVLNELAYEYLLYNCGFIHWRHVTIKDWYEAIWKCTNSSEHVTPQVYI